MASRNTNIMLPSMFDISQVQFGNPRVSDNGRKSIYVNYNKAPIILQTPAMIAPFGIQRWEGDTGNKYTLELSFRGMEEREGLKTFFDKINEFSDYLVDAGTKNQFEWLKKKGCTKDTIKELFTPQIRYATDRNTGEINTKYPPTFKLSIPFVNGSFDCDVFDNKKNPIDLSNIDTKGAKITAIIQCNGIWVAAGNFGCTWKVKVLKVVPVQKISGYAFLDVPEDEVEVEAHDDEVDRPVSSAKASRTMSVLACDDDDDLDV